MMKPTDEQQEAIDLFSSGSNLAIEAGAGTGKTSTLRFLAYETQHRGAYVAFNRAIVEEARRKMPDNVASSTAHSLAFRAVGVQFAHRLRGGRMRSGEIARQLGVDPFVVRYGSESKVLQPSQLASMVQRAITRFCQSADVEPGPEHLPYIEGIDVPKPDGSKGWANNDAVRAVLAPHIDTAWRDLCDVDGKLPYKHDHYLKFWQLHEPRIPGEFVLFDEAQDAAPVMLAAVEAQTDSQLVFVGDSQQQIYEWRGAINALEQVPAEERAMLTQSFRFGPAIAEVANLLLARIPSASLRLKGWPQVESAVIEVPRPDCILTRTNAGAVRLLLQGMRDGRRVHLVGGAGEVLAFTRGARDLMRSGWTSYPDLMCFTSWQQVVEYVAQDPQGDELALLVSLVEEFGVEPILQALEKMPPEHEAEQVVSTAHKAKGREWSKVKLFEDFADPGQRTDSAGEWRLLYVACTRAQHQLDVSACQPVHELTTGRYDSESAKRALLAAAW